MENLFTILVGVLAAIAGVFIGSKFLTKKQTVVTEPKLQPVMPEIKEKTEIIEKIIKEQKDKANSNAEKIQNELNKIQVIPDEKERLEKLAELVNKL